MDGLEIGAVIFGSLGGLAALIRSILKWREFEYRKKVEAGRRKAELWAMYRFARDREVLGEGRQIGEPSLRDIRHQLGLDRE